MSKVDGEERACLADLTRCTFGPRIALLDAADALSEQLDVVVLVGAQAIHLHTGDADFATAEYTTDTDFCVAPAELDDTPLSTETAGRARGSNKEHRE